jgi:hypothetical protein
MRNASCANGKATEPWHSAGFGGVGWLQGRHRPRSPVIEREAADILSDASRRCTGLRTNEADAIVAAEALARAEKLRVR